MSWLGLLSLVCLVWGEEPADIGFGMGDDHHNFKVQPGKGFKVKIADYKSTGYAWFLEKLSPGVNMVSNRTGGGDDEPPFILCEMSTSDGFRRGNVTWVHVHPWQLDDPTADREYAVLELRASEGEDTLLI
mmetsp:Transcript_11275/g.20003  ORF Transcript_11275/g.20003 Transcript_11275/m.20003 type:complete len:131 (-) Transcript_11275:66-458(-)